VVKWARLRLSSIAAVVGVVVWAVGCTAAPTVGQSVAPSTSAAVTSGRWVAPVASATSGCHSVNALPDPRCTPGATDPSVTQANIHSTICVAGYSASVRPPVSVTEPIKRSELRAYGLSVPLADLELDHLVALSDGGAPASVANLWPQSRTNFPGAAEKDQLEDYLHRRICAGAISLTAAQEAMATNWVAAYCTARLPECSDGVHIVPAAARPSVVAGG
jgi:hypothetical protein